MSTAELRGKLHEYIDMADEKHIEAMYLLLEKEMNTSYVLDKETIQELERREQEYLSGSGESYTAEESVEMIRKSLKKD
jgi:hypothetical protein